MQIQDINSRGSTVRTCTVCGVEFLAFNSAIRRGKATTCGHACHMAKMHAGNVKPFLETFWSNVNKTDTCWLWTRARTRGYGYFRGQLVHRIAWAEAAGTPAPDALMVLHNCPDGDNPSCLRNDGPGIYMLRGVAHPMFGHLWLGTREENMWDMINKGRAVHDNGERASKAKLTETQVIAARARYDAGGITISDLARQYGITHQGMSSIVKRQHWRHIP